MTLRPKLVDRLILAEVVPLFLVLLVVFTVIILVVASADLFGYLTQGATPIMVFNLIIYNILPWLVPTFPMAMLLATTIGMVRLSTQSEIVALFAAGVPFRRLMAPVVAFSIGASLLALFINDTVAPYANKQFDQIKASITGGFGGSVKAFDLPPVRDKHQRLEILVHVDGGYNAQTRSLRQVYITYVDPATGNVKYALYAPSAIYSGGSNYTLQNTTGLMGDGNSYYAGNLRVSQMQDPATIKLITTPTDELNIHQLAAYIVNPKHDKSKLPGYEVNLWERFSLPLACFAFAIIGAPLGLRPQRNAALGIAITSGLGIIFVYYALYQYMDVLASTGHANPMFAAFLSDLLALVVGIALLRRTSS